MLNPVSDPYQPPGRPSGLSRLFLLGVLVENYHFLSGWSIQSTLLSFNMSVQLTNRRGEVNPADAMVYLTLYTKLNTGLLLEGAGGGRKDTGGVPVPSFTLYVVECPATTVVAILQSKRLTCRVARASDRGISAMVHARVRPCRELPRSEPTALK